MIAAPASPNENFRSDTATNCTHDVIQKISEMKNFATGKLSTFFAAVFMYVEADNRF